MQFQVVNNPSLATNLKQLESTSDLFDPSQKRHESSNFMIVTTTNNTNGIRKVYKKTSQANLNFKSTDELIDSFNSYKCNSDSFNF